ncbi:TlpA disulfide reductase family protein [uncultured Maribacter sp.]|uniref:peroxiredoxin family protein n=1 Tax=uncultured Maribacter sp. TaxID=431308 RepID=UPI0026178B8F|nr:TlpA disulfide reductase family protein [uncultured Maribacter sp.]
MFFFSCKKEDSTGLKKGDWLANLTVLDQEKLPFNFRIMSSEKNKTVMEVYNAEEVIKVDEIEFKKDSVFIKLPIFEGFIVGKYTDTTITGQFIKRSLDRVVPFNAVYGKKERFSITKKAVFNISGVWETEFSGGTEDGYMSKGIFAQEGSNVTGTFRTTTGDYRYLEGVVNGNVVSFSAFDGAHAFLFKAKITDSTMHGTFYSGNHFKEPFVAKRNESFELPDANDLTFLKDGYDSFDFSFPDETGKMVSLSDKRFTDKVVIVQIMGTWCPNCLDESKFLVDYLKGNSSKELEVVALAFEYAKTKEKAYESIKRLKSRIGIKYPVLLAQYGTSDKVKAQKKLPMLNHVLSYPTSIFIDKKGGVRKIHTGFNGPATGSKYISFKKEFNSFVEKLVNE